MEKEIAQFFKNKVESSIDKTIEYLRYSEKEKQNGLTKIGGNEHLKFMLDNGVISMTLFIQLKQTVDFPNAPYKITLTT